MKIIENLEISSKCWEDILFTNNLLQTGNQGGSWNMDLQLLLPGKYVFKHDTCFLFVKDKDGETCKSIIDGDNIIILPQLEITKLNSYLKKKDFGYKGKYTHGYFIPIPNKESFENLEGEDSVILVDVKLIRYLMKNGQVYGEQLNEDN